MSMGGAADESMTWSSTAVPVSSRDSARSSADRACGIAGCHGAPDGRRAHLRHGVLGEDVIRVPWEQVGEITSTLRLKAKATELGLAQGEEEAARFVRK